jgi:hypothetical protein
LQQLLVTTNSVDGRTTSGMPPVRIRGPERRVLRRRDRQMLITGFRHREEAGSFAASPVKNRTAAQA